VLENKFFEGQAGYCIPIPSLAYHKKTYPHKKKEEYYKNMTQPKKKKK
jgi:hypothetical protein